MKSVLSVTTGNENIQGAMSKAYLFAIIAGKEDYISGGGTSKITALGSPSIQDASPGKRHDVCGSWRTQSFEVEDGVMLKYFVTAQNGFGDLGHKAQIFIRARAQGAYMKIKGALTGAAGTSRSSVELHVCGDLLTLEQAEAYGYRVNEKFRRAATALSSGPSVRSAFTVSIMRDEVEAVAKGRIVNSRTDDGGTISRGGVRKSITEAAKASMIFGIKPSTDTEIVQTPIFRVIKKRGNEVPDEVPPEQPRPVIMPTRRRHITLD